MTLAYRLNNPTSLSLFCDSNGLQGNNYRSNICSNHKEAAQKIIGNSGSSIRNLMMMMKIRKKILIFRDALCMRPCEKPIKEVMVETIDDLHNQFPHIVPEPSISDLEKSSISQGLVHLCNALKSLRDTWLKHNKCKQPDDGESLEDMNMDQIGERVMEMLDRTTKVASEVIQTMHVYEKSEKNKESSSNTNECNMEQLMDLDSKPTPLAKDHKSKIPHNINNVMPDERLSITNSFRPPQTLTLAPQDIPLQKVEMSFGAPISTSQTPVIRPLPPTPPSIQPEAKLLTGMSSVQPPMKGAPPPPPPPLGAKMVLSPLKSNTKLKRSTNLGNLYRHLKRKLDGSNTCVRKSDGKKFKARASNDKKEGMTGAIAEMMKRSSYYQQIEKDVQNHGNKINEIKSSIIAFQNKDMEELINFRKYIETSLEPLTDETQVLARFEGFPRTKLESIRSAAALYIKLDGMLDTLKTWKIVAPLSQLLDKVESYFNKIKVELDELERHKEEDSKRFQSENIHFNFQIIQKIKESMVDVSSGCIKLALEDRRRTMANKGHGSVNMLWRAFQLAFRVYIFAGGQDDQAERLTTELAEEIEADAQE